MADIVLFVVNVTFVVGKIIKEHVITSSMTKISYVVAEITFKIVVVTS